MSREKTDRVEFLLRRLRNGDQSAEDEMFSLVHAELRAIAHRRMPHNGAHTLQPTALVNEAYIRLCGHGDGCWNDRQHFFRAAARAMGWVLKDHARRARAQKRPDPADRIELDPDVFADFERRAVDLVALDDALSVLRAQDEQTASLVQMHFFCGRTFAECADLLDISERTARRWWGTARRFLYREIEGRSKETGS